MLVATNERPDGRPALSHTRTRRRGGGSMAQTAAREILEAAEKAETKGKEAAARKEFEKADDYFKFAAMKYRKISVGLKDDAKKSKLVARAEKLDALARQCRSAAKKSASQRIEPDVANELADEPAEKSAEETLKQSASEEAVGIPDEGDETELKLDESPAPFAPPPPAAVPVPPPAKAGAKIPKTKRLRRAKLPGKKTSQIVPAPKLTVVEAPTPAAPDGEVENGSSDASDVTVEDAAPVEPYFQHDPSDDTLDEIPDGHEPLPPVVTRKTVSSSGSAPRVVSENDLNELVDDAPQTASVVINLDAVDFPKEVLKPGEFSIDLSPRFTEHLCKALVMGDLEEIANKFNKLADNLIRKAMGGDPRDELDLRYTALACREVADRLTDQPAASPVKEIEQARKAYRRGDHIGAATQYKQAAMRLLGHEGKDAPEKLSLHERQASEFLNFSSRLRQVSEQG